VNSKRWLVGPLVLLTGLALSGCGLLDLLEPPLAPPAAPPAELTASLGELETQVRIQWAPVEGATFYEVFRAEDPEAYFAPLGTTSTTSWFDQPAEDHPLPPGVLYWYRVRACNQAGCSQLSDSVFGYAGYPPPSPPGSAPATAFMQVTSRWTGPPSPGPARIRCSGQPLGRGTTTWLAPPPNPPTSITPPCQASAIGTGCGLAISGAAACPPSPIGAAAPPAHPREVVAPGRVG
jgi:hypothetical protein